MPTGAYITAPSRAMADVLCPARPNQRGADAALSEQLIEDSLYMLILHEIGHTLGLTHNMRASQLQPDVFDADAVAALGLSGSVMDYEAVNVAPDGKTQTWFYQKRQDPTMPGPQYGYGVYSDTRHSRF